MHTVVFLVKKKAGMSQAEFTRYWIDDVVHEVYPPRDGT